MTTTPLFQKDAVKEAILFCTDSFNTINKEKVVDYLLGMFDEGRFLIKSEAKKATEVTRRVYIKSLLSHCLKNDTSIPKVVQHVPVEEIAVLPPDLSTPSLAQDDEVESTPDLNQKEETVTAENIKKMGVNTGIFPIKIVVNNCPHDQSDWLRNIDMIIFRFPSRRKDGTYDINLVDFSNKINNSLNANGWCIVFAYGSIENKLRPFEFATTLKDTGLNLVDIVAISRPWWGGKRSDTHLALSYEHVFLFCKSDKWYLDRSPIYPLVIGSKYEGVTCPGNAWDLNNYNPAVNYPADLASALMRMVCLLPGSVILDPFMGGASGIEAAVECGHSFIGYESNTDRYNKYSKVLKRVQKQIDERDADHERTEA